MNRPLGNGETTCYICNYSFGILSGTPRICNDCLKHVCMTCSIDALSSSKNSTIWLCKICAEYRDVNINQTSYFFYSFFVIYFSVFKLLKKTGAWFNKRIPKKGTSDAQSSISPSLSLISNSSSIAKMRNSNENLNQSDMKCKISDSEQAKRVD
jgi:hypothetical protein